jgi:hypothetical protein
MKAQTTAKELDFIAFRLSGHYTIIQAMKLAGYLSDSESYLYNLAQKIVQKYEQQAGDHRKIMREMGYGEVKIIEMMIEAATKFKSETVRAKCRETLGKWLGLQTEEIEGVEGITIIVRSGQGDGSPAKPCERPLPVALLPGPGTRMIK